VGMQKRPRRLATLLAALVLVGAVRLVAVVPAAVATHPNGAGPDSAIEIPLTESGIWSITLDDVSDNGTDLVKPACGLTGRPDIWFRIDFTQFMNVHIDTSGSEFDTVASTWVPDGNGGVSQLLYSYSCNDDSEYAGGLASEIFFQATSGTYYIVVSPYSLNDLRSPKGLTLNVIARPFDDEFTISNPVSVDIPGKPAGGTVEIIVTCPWGADYTSTVVASNSKSSYEWQATGICTRYGTVWSSPPIPRGSYKVQVTTTSAMRGGGTFFFLSSWDYTTSKGAVQVRY